MQVLIKQATAKASVLSQEFVVGPNAHAWCVRSCGVYMACTVLLLIQPHIQALAGLPTWEGGRQPSCRYNFELCAASKRPWTCTD